MTTPETWLGLAAVVVVTVGGWVTALIQHRGQNAQLRGQSKQLAQLEEQMVNGHGPTGLDRNLRTDIDRLIELGEENATGLAELRGEVRGLTHRVDQLDRRLT